MIHAAAPSTTVWVSDPTWGNHVPLLGSSGLRLERYPYYDAAAHALRFDAMLECLERAAAGDVVLLHACCHNPSGADLCADQWATLIELLQRRRLVPFLDLAYQGFAHDLATDVAPLQRVAASLPEVLIATSFSKNLGLYRERVGALIVVSESESRADAVQSHVLHIARGIYSMPPDHGAAIVNEILADSTLREQWTDELGAMRKRIGGLRVELVKQLAKACPERDFGFIAAQQGMFSFLGVTTPQVHALREKHHVYMTDDSRINIAGLRADNLEYFAKAVAQVLRVGSAQ